MPGSQSISYEKGFLDNNHIVTKFQGASHSAPSSWIDAAYGWAWCQVSKYVSKELAKWQCGKDLRTAGSPSVAKRGDPVANGSSTEAVLSTRIMSTDIEEKTVMYPYIPVGCAFVSTCTASPVSWREVVCNHGKLVRTHLFPTESRTWLINYAEFQISIWKMCQFFQVHPWIELRVVKPTVKAHKPIQQ
eukprot:3687885-Amphidinium_carterae.2